MKKPKVTVLMSVYNGEKYLREAIDSILNQTFGDFEFLIIDNGSMDGTAAILRDYRDDRIKPISNKNKLSLAESLNKGLALARGQYTARMDADDISLPERLEKQAKFLDANPAICVVGSWWKNIDKNNKVIGLMRVPARDYECAFMMFAKGENPVGHPCVMYRTAKIKESGGYDPEYKNAEDVELWFRLNVRGFQIANIPETMILYRLHGGQMSAASRAAAYHHRALSKFLSGRLAQDIQVDLAASIRPANSNDGCFREKCQIDRMFLLKRQSIQAYLRQYNLANDQLFSCVMVLWESLLPLCRLKAIPAGEMMARNFKFCLEILSSNWKGPRGVGYNLRLVMFAAQSSLALERAILRKIWTKFRS